MSYAELQVTSHFSFLRGASSPEELFAAAALLGIEAVAITDRHTVTGLVHGLEAAKATGVRLIVGCRLDLLCGTSLLIYPIDRAGYGRMCRLLTLGKSRAGKGGCDLDWPDVEVWAEGLIAILLPDDTAADLANELARLHRVFGDRAYCGLTRRFLPNEGRRLRRIADAAATAGVPTVALNDILYHCPTRRILQDVVTCIRLGTTIDDAGLRKERQADRHLKPPAEVRRLFAKYPEAVARTAEIARRCTFSLTELTYTYPTELTQDGLSAQERLEKLTWEGAGVRYPDGLPDPVATQLRHELNLIERMGYAPYFLTVESIVRFSRSKGILCQGRGSAANSAVCFVLGVTSIDPVRQGLLFERFVSEERREPPDIDVDFEHERREEVIQWVYGTYGRTRAALTAVVTRYRSKLAIREVGKALGVPEDVTGVLAGLVWGWSKEGAAEKDAKELNLNLDDRRLRLTIEVAKQLIDTPRHTSQHPGGFVLTLDRLDELCPIEPAAMENRQIIEWDKDDIDALKFMKVDVLGLGMLGCMRRAFDILAKAKGIPLDLATIPAEDPITYEMIRRADTLGTFQIESPAQMSMLPRLKPTTFYDLVIQVAIVRPGPIQGDMVHPYLRRREGLETPHYPTPELEKVLGKTLGVPLFQEQAMQVAMVAAGFSPTEADQLRRAMATFKFTGGVNAFQQKLIDGMLENGYTRKFAERTFRQLEGFGSYGFPESHAASFALIAYASSWMKCHHPDVFLAAILNAQPMGFYAPAQLIRDAREHGVEVRPVDVNGSDWDCTLETTTNGRYQAVRLGFCMVRSLKEKNARQLVERRAFDAIATGRDRRAFASIEDVWRRAGVDIATLRHIADADGFAGLGHSRREALWAIRGLRDQPMPLFAAADDRDRQLRPEVEEPAPNLPAMTDGQQVVTDYRVLGFSLRRHPLFFLRDDLARRGYRPCRDVRAARNGARLSVAGLVLNRQMPGSAKGVMFANIEDESGETRLIIWPKVFERFRKAILAGAMFGVDGTVQHANDVTHLVVRRVINLTGDLEKIAGTGMPLVTARGDVVKGGGHGPDSRDAKPVIAKPRDIYIPDLHIDTIALKARNFR